MINGLLDKTSTAGFLISDVEFVVMDVFFFFLRLVEVSCYGSQISLYDVEMAVPSVLKPDLIDV